MTIKIYHKRSVFNGFVLDDNPECTFCNVSAVEIGKTAIFGTIDGEQLTIKLDRINYHYAIV